MKEEIKNILVFALIIIFMFLLLVSVIVLIKNIKELKTDPLKYGMNAHSYVYCSCIDTDGKVWTSSENGFVHRENIYGDYKLMPFQNVSTINS